MDFKRGFSDVSNFLKKKKRQIFNKEENAEEEVTEDKAVDAASPEGGKSMTKGETGTIFGLSRPVVIGIVIIFFLVFGLAFIYASTDDSDATKQQEQASQGKTTDIADPNRANRNKNGGEVTDDYGALARANAAKNKNQQNPNNPNNPNQPNGQPNGNPQEGQPQNMQPAQAVQAQPTPVPAIPRTSVVVPPAGGSYSQSYALPSQNTDAERKCEEDRTAAERLREKLKSAIAFAYDGGSSTKDDSASASNAGGSSPASAQAVAGMSAAGAGANLMQTSTGSTTPVYTEPTERTVMAGTIIPAMLVTGINTDAAGPVIAQVMANVYDMNGRTLIIPAGSRVLGTMGGSSNSEGGSNTTTGRIAVTFDTVVLPNGGAWNVGKSIMAVDGMGYSGLRGNLHRHTESNLMKGLFNSVLTALSTAAVDRVTFDASALTSLTETQAPTATVAPGYSFNLYVTQNIAF